MGWRGDAGQDGTCLQACIQSLRWICEGGGDDEQLFPLKECLVLVKKCMKGRIPEKARESGILNTGENCSRIMITLSNKTAEMMQMHNDAWIADTHKTHRRVDSGLRGVI